MWNLKYTQLLEYKQKNGHCQVPASNELLGEWVSICAHNSRISINPTILLLLLLASFPLTPTIPHKQVFSLQAIKCSIDTYIHRLTSAHLYTWSQVAKQKKYKLMGVLSEQRQIQLQRAGLWDGKQTPRCHFITSIYYLRLFRVAILCYIVFRLRRILSCV